MLERPPFPRLANAMRRQILLVLGRQGQSLFLNLARLLQVKDHRKINFLPKVLREAGFSPQCRERSCALTATGRRAAGCLSFLSKKLNP